MVIFNYILRLYEQKKQLALLSFTYATIVVVMVCFAGIIALINQSVGVAILILPLIAMIALVLNVVMWSLIRFAVESLGTSIAESKMRNWQKNRSSGNQIRQAYGDGSNGIKNHQDH